MPSVDVLAEERSISRQISLADSPSTATGSSKLVNKGEKKSDIVKKMPCSPYEKCGGSIPEDPPPQTPKMNGPPLEKNGIIQSSEGATGKSTDDEASKQPTEDDLATPSSEESGSKAKEDALPEIAKRISKTGEPGQVDEAATALKAEPEPQSEPQPEPKAEPEPETKSKKPAEVDGGSATVNPKPESKPKPKLEYKKPEDFAAISDLKARVQAKAKAKAKGKASLSLLEMDYYDPEGKGHGRLVRRQSSPASFSTDPQSPTEDVVFKKEEPYDSTKTSEMSVNNKTPEVQIKKEPEAETVQDSVTQKQESQDGQNKEVGTEAGAGRSKREDSNRNKAKENSSQKDVKQEKPEVTDEKAGDAQMAELVQGIQKGLTLGSDPDREERGGSSSDVCALTKDFERGMKLEGIKTGEKMGHKTEVSVGGTVQPGVGRLRAKGIHQLGDGRQGSIILSTNNTFAMNQQSQWAPLLQQQQQQQQHHLMHQPQQRFMYQQQQPPMPKQRLPPFHSTFKPTTSQCVVSPPGQVFMGASSMVGIRPAVQSKQIQYAQQNLLLETSQAQLLMQQSYVAPQQPMNIPGESTGTPSEVDWPPTPESDASEVADDLLDIISSNEEMSCASGNSEGHLMQESGHLQLTGLPSPPSTWSQPPSIASGSPAPSPYADPNQSPSPYLTGPLSPESSVGSPGLPPSPHHFIHVTGTMSSGRVTVSATNKRKRNDSYVSTDSQEAKEGITRIKNYLKEQPDASPGHGLGFWQGSSPQPEHGVYPSACTPPYVSTPSPVPTAPPQQQTSLAPSGPASCAFREGELDAYRREVANQSVDTLLHPDEDKDTHLHLAICKKMEPLSLAIIERVCTCNQKERLNCTNLEGQTPLFLAAVSNLPILTQILINYGADPTIGNIQGNTPLHVAAMYGHYDVIKAILEGLTFRGYSSDYAYSLFNCRNYEGKTPLILAVQSHSNPSFDRNIVDCTETVKLLLNTYASAMVQDSKSGKTALHYTMESCKVDMMLTLLENCEDAGCLANSQMYDGNTALHLIVGRSLRESQILEVVGILMAYGANVGLENAAKDKPQQLLPPQHTEVKKRLQGQASRKR